MKALVSAVQLQLSLVVIAGAILVFEIPRTYFSVYKKEVEIDANWKQKKFARTGIPDTNPWADSSTAERWIGWKWKNILPYQLIYRYSKAGIHPLFVALIYIASSTELTSLPRAKINHLADWTYWPIAGLGHSWNIRFGCLYFRTFKQMNIQNRDARIWILAKLNDVS